MVTRTKPFNIIVQVHNKPSQKLNIFCEDALYVMRCAPNDNLFSCTVQGKSVASGPDGWVKNGLLEAATESTIDSLVASAWGVATASAAVGASSDGGSGSNVSLNASVSIQLTTG